MKLREHEHAFNEWIADGKRFWKAMSTIGGVLAVILTLSIAYSCVSEAPAQSEKPVSGGLDCRVCHSKHAAMTEYFRKAGSITPEAMAEAVLATKSPRLLAAVAKVETGGNPHIRRGGRKGMHAGAFQVNSKIHGRVSMDPVKQALQAEAILSELTETMPVKRALSIYGGDPSSRYHKTILAELVRVP